MLTFTYKNHRSEVEERTIVPTSLDYNTRPNPEYGYGPGWFLTGKDYSRGRDGVIRSFALSNIQLPNDAFIHSKIIQFVISKG